MAYESTSVPVEKSQGDVRKMLSRHGAERFAFGEDREAGGQRWAAVSFSYSGQSVRIRVPLKMVDESAVHSKYMRARSKDREQIRDELYEQEERRIWRVIAWNLKARMVAVEEGVETFEEAFLAHLINDATGRTVYEELSENGTIQLGTALPQLMPGE